MKNLQLLELVHKSVGDIFSQVEIFTQAPDSIYFIRNKSLHKYDLNHENVLELCPEPFENVILIKFLTIECKICIVIPDSLYIFDLDGIKIGTVSFGNEIAAISWNSTEELVVTVSNDGQINVYSVDYENCEIFPRGETLIDAKVPDTVYVGWGSKDTQFRGSEGKLKREQAPVQVEPVSDQKPTIFWRGNGEMFVVNYWVDNKRKFVVLETPCKALYRSEDCPGLQPLIAWRPTGNMIATLTEISHKQSIVIFEKNGQKRFNFDLDLGDVKIEKLQWSSCARILTISSFSPNRNLRNIHLLTCSNYKWYEKQTLTFTSDNPLIDFDWLETTLSTFTLRVITLNEIITYTFCTLVNNSSAICGVINGKYLQLTDFKDAIIPPPMYTKQIINDKSINFVFLASNFAAIVDSDSNLKIYELNNLDFIASINLKDKIDDTLKIPLAYHHFLFRGNNVYFAAETDSECVFYGLSPQNNDINFIDATTEPFRHIMATETNSKIVGFKQIGDGIWINCNNLANSVELSVKIIKDKAYTYSLTSNCHFYVNDNKINDGVNSFLVFDNYLLYTTKLNELYCLRLTEEAMDELLNDGTRNYRRNIEQGATITTAIPNSPRIVLQLPRGNLETISCRLISIDILDRLLENEKWDEAFRFIRLEKLNANLLFDLNPNRFLERIDCFISSTKTVNELNSVCLEMEEGNVLNTIYKNWGKSQDFPGKIPTIFAEIFKYFDSIDYSPYITTIMIINLHFFTLRDALVYLQDQLRRSYDDFSLKKNLIEAVSTLKTYGCDQEKLYTEALLLYDLDLAHFVASCCQMDPRIYEPHLNRLKNLTEIQRRYAISLYGKKPKVAIEYLLRCPETSSDEILNFIQTHRVSREAYESCKKNSKHYQIVAAAFADDLSKKGCHQEAGIVLKRANLLEKALGEFQAGLKWREVLNLIEELKMDDVDKLRIINDVAKGLTQRHLIKDAAILYEFHANNYEMAVKILIHNYFFDDAIHIAKKHNRNDIIVADIVPVLIKHKNYLEEKLMDLSRSYDKYKSRLSQVRSLKLTKFNNFHYDGDDRDDLFSDVGSVTSTKSSRSSRSRSSTASSRNRRKEEKKKQDLREGGIYEDIALIRALHGIIKEIYAKGDEVRNCCVLLMQESDVSYREVKVLYDLYKNIVNSIKDGVGEIWPPHFYSIRPRQNPQEVVDLENFDLLDIVYRTPPNSPQDWNLTLFT